MQEKIEKLHIENLANANVHLRSLERLFSKMTNPTDHWLTFNLQKSEKVLVF